MSVRVVSTSGNGGFVEDSLISFSYQEDITSLEPSSIEGGTGQVSFSVEAINDDAIGFTKPNSKLLINNQMALIDSDNGTVSFQVKTVSVSDGTVVNVTGDTVSAKLNTVKTAKPFPHEGSDYTLKAALNYYCGLAGVTPVYDDNFDVDLDGVQRKFIGWKANVWEQLKLLCAGVCASDTDNVGIEMYVDNGELHFRKALSRSRSTAEKAISQSISIDSSESAKSIDVINYNTSYAQDAVIFPEQLYSDGETAGTGFRSSINDSMQVESGQTITKRFPMAVTLEKINQPECVSTIIPLPYDGPVGKYVIVGSDNLPIMPAQWLGEGGKVTVALTDVPNEIEVTVTGPKALSLPTAANSNVQTFAPYKIGVETSDGVDYPAFYITGTGVFYNKQNTNIVTGASTVLTNVDDSPTSVDNIFITTPHDASAKGVAAAQKICGPQINLTRTVDGLEGFGSLIGSTEYFESNRFRVTSATYSESDISLTYSTYVSFADFNAKWADRDIEDFNMTALKPLDYPYGALAFNEFTVIPLMKEI
jgi:hypothetical protein